MPHVSKYKLSGSQVNQLSQRIVEATFSIKNKKNLQLFFDDLLSTTEKIMLGKRLLIALMIESGHSYFDIRKTAGVTDATIASISERLKSSGRGLRLAIKRLQRQENIEALLQRFGNAITGSIPRLPRIAYLPRVRKPL
ncbi:MAG: hypothetical protein HYT40_02365 [Candidatus Sungbacteria bacterium]|uniref:TrpR like protein, YerC/YecD n=1 Tax=Candidatus Sungiibacteriota bacterium TaxID=2750080 RepID=A0A931SCS1_9BACT|nr:hypothetical protein [Candidatus Sungbacteria bacterium]